MENDEILKISLKNQQKLWEKCPYCGIKPKEVEWGTRYLTVGCDKCILMPVSTIGYGEDENDFKDVMQDLRSGWNKMCLVIKREIRR